MTLRSIPFAALCLLMAGQSAFANEYTALLKARKYAEVERAANAKLAQDPANADALVARSEAVLAMGPESRIEEAVKLGEQCVAAHPQVSNCHLAYGNALGSKAMNSGMMAAMRYAGTIRDSFAKAVELDPQNIDARFSMLQYYIQAPSIAGGGTAKAQAFATQTATVNADVGKLLVAMLDIGAEQYAKAEAAALAVRPGANEALADQQRDVLANLGGKYVNEKKYADAERVFQEVVKRFPDSDSGPYGLARVQQEQGKHREAIAGFEKALALADRPHIHYRIARSWQALNDKPKAIAAFEKALAFKGGLNKKFRADAEDQLKALKG
jgi:tetratricopeptide (TPR) repeat protein